MERPYLLELRLQEWPVFHNKALLCRRSTHPPPGNGRYAYNIAPTYLKNRSLAGLGTSGAVYQYA